MALALTVVGMGSRGRDWVRAIRSIPDMELAAYVDTDDTRLQLAARSLGLAPEQCFPRLEMALDAIPCRAVIVATSLNRHAEPCRTAIARRLGILVEKPFTTDLREATALVREAEAAHVPIVVGQNYRYTRAPQTVKRLLDARVIGRIGKFHCRVYRSPQPTLSPAVSEVPDGLVWELVIHHVDALRYLFGEPDRVFARIATPGWDDRHAGTSLDVLFESDAGPSGCLEAFLDSRGHEFFEQGREHYLRVAGETATLHVLNRWLLCCPRGRLPRPVRRGPRRETEEVRLLRQLGESLGSGAEPECSGRDNLKTLAILEACLRSAATGRWIEPRELLRADA